MKRRRPVQLSILSKIFGLDLRSLAAFRVGVALFIIADLVSRSLNLTAHYTDDGVLPRLWANQYFTGNALFSLWNPAVLSMHMLTGSFAGTAAIFLVHGLAAIALLLGFRTRLFTFIVWFLLSSLHARNPLVLSVGDDVLRVLLFFAIFLPLGARYSIDAALNSAKKDDSDTYFSPSTAAYCLQFIAIYFFSALLKSGPEWRAEGTALYYAFNFDQFALAAGKALLAQPDFLRVLSFSVWWIELLGAFILLVPHRVARLFGITLFASLQFGIAMTLALGHNPIINTIVLFPFLPGSVWRRRERALPKIEIIYDGDCGFCRKAVMVLVEFLRPRLIDDPRPAQGKDLFILRRENSWIVRSEGAPDAFRFDALVRCIAASPLLFWTAPFFRLGVVQRIGTWVYRWVASHRGFNARLFSFLRFRPVGLRLPAVVESIAVFLLACVILYNAAWVTPLNPLPAVLEFPILLSRLEQYWGMFAPAPNRDDGWYVVEGRLRNGSQVDALRKTSEISYEKPRAAADFYPDERWRRYMINIGTRDQRQFREPFTSYVCRDWNGSHTGAEHLDGLSLFFMSETSRPPGQPIDVVKQNFRDHACR